MPELDQSKEVKVERVEELTEEMPDKVEEVEEVDEKVEEPEEEDDDGWIDILGSGDLKKKVLVTGEPDSRPIKGMTVVVNVAGKVDGTEEEVDTHNNLIFTVGDSEVIVGLDMIVPLMDKGEVAEVFVASRFAYGSRGLEPSIPPDTDLTFRVELVDCKPEEEPDSLPVEKRMVIGNRKRERGNWWFNREEYTLAIQCYSAAVDFLDDTQEEYGEDVRPEVISILSERLKALNNMGAAQMKVEAYDAALKSLEAVLRCQPDNVKALFRKGKVLGLQGKASEAVVSLRRALELEPESRLVHQELARVRERAKEEAESERSLYRRMLGLKGGSGRAEGAAEEQRRYPTIKTFPWKTWFVAFMTILLLLLAYQRGPALSGVLQ